MFTYRQVLEFCNTQIIYRADKFLTADKHLKLDDMVASFIFELALEDEVKPEDLKPAVERWWRECRFNPHSKSFKA